MKPQHGTTLPAPNAPMFLACGAAIATLVPVALHQTGVLDHLPDPRGSIFDSDAITDSKAAHPFGVPDGLLGLASYGLTMSLMIAARDHSGARKLLAAKLVADGGAAAFNTVRQGVQFRMVCSWCTGTALATAAMLFAARGLLGDASRLAADVVQHDLP